MRTKDTRPVLARNLALATVLLAALAACTAPEEPLGQCEPGVSGLSGLGTVAPGHC